VTQNKFLNEVQAKIIEKGFTVTALSKTVEQANKVFRAIQFTLGLFGAIALIVSAIGMFNTMTVTLLERTNEIGIMRTIGASSTDIMMMFLGESTLMGFCGGVVGIVMGVSIGKLINFLLNLVAVKMGGVAVKLVIFPLPFLAFVLLFSFVMGFLTGLFPARRAASLNPLEAIRYK
jgi:putative ABC transport system permease protein